MRHMFFPLLIAALPLPALAQSYLSINRLHVFSISATDMEVIEERGEGARGIWCAAADFTLQRNGQVPHQRLYVKEARGPSMRAPGRKGTVFTTDVNSLPVNASKAYSVSVNIPGQGLPVVHAYQFCQDYLIELRDF